MHIGLIGGIGPAATYFYYLGIIRAVDDLGGELELTIAHASAPALIANFGSGDETAQADIFKRLIDQLRAAGAEVAAVTSIGGHFCIEALKRISALPLIDIVEAVAEEIQGGGYKKLGIIGTRKAMETRLYGGLSSVEIVLPDEADLDRVHRHYVAMAVPGMVTEAQRKVFFSVGRRLCEDQGAEAVLLGGTDLFLAFDDQDCGFKTIDCAAIHVAALARAASSRL